MKDAVQKYVLRFRELDVMATEVLNTEYSIPQVFPGDRVKVTPSHQWGTNCLSAFERAFGKASPYYEKFDKLYKDLNRPWAVKTGKGIVQAAISDLESGVLTDTKTLIQSEVFDSFLEQAEELFRKGYYQAAAVVAGCVLEDALREIGRREVAGFRLDATIDPMNAELCKAGIYTVLQQKKITALADVRNKAAHGKWQEFSSDDVEEMLSGIRRFMENCFS